MFLFKILNLKKKKNIRQSITTTDQKIIQKKWSEIEELIKLGGPSCFQKAIIEADKLLDFVLSQMGYEGKLGDKLKLAKEEFIKEKDYSLYNDIWRAHKLRNELVHNLNYEIYSFEVKEVIKKFEKAFKNLGVL